MISPDSDLYRAHPDWCLHGGRPRPIAEARQQLILDLSRKDVQDYLIGALSDVLSNDLDRLREVGHEPQHDRATSAARSCPSGRTRAQHRYMLGLYRADGGDHLPLPQGAL